MEIVKTELRDTVDRVKAHQADPRSDRDPQLLRHLVQEIAEDMAQLERYRSSFKDREDEYVTLLTEAKRTKREIEREALTRERDAKRAEAVANAAAAEREKERLRLVAETAKANQGATGAATRGSGYKTLRIKLPVFDGETGEDYRGFRDAFNDVLKEEPDLGEVKKWLLLKAQLVGRALELVKEMPTTPETYKAAVRILDDAFGSKRRAVLRAYEKLIAMPPAEMEETSLQKTHSQLGGILMQLEGLGADVDGNDVIFALVTTKFPDSLLDQLKVDDTTQLAEFREGVAAYIKRKGCVMRRSNLTADAANPSGSMANATGGSKGGADGIKGKPRHVQGAPAKSGGADATERAPSGQVTKNNSNNASKKRSERPVRRCIFCTGDHWADECDKQKTLAEREKFVEDRCKRCLKKHVDGECKSSRVCFYCKDPLHNSALCPKQFAKVLLMADDIGNGLSRFMTAVLPVGNVALTTRGEHRAVLDTCGGRSLITAALAKELALERVNGRSVVLSGVNGAQLGAGPSAAYRLALFPPGRRVIEIEVFAVSAIVDDVISARVADVKAKYPQFATLPMPPEGNGRPVQILLGYRALMDVLTLHRSILLAPRLQLMSTKFGWVPFGVVSEEEAEPCGSSVVGLIREVDPVRMMSDLELVGLSDLLRTDNDEEALVLDKFYKTIRRDGKRYEVEWPYRDDDPVIDDNFGLAFGRLVSLHRQLSKTPTMLRAYDALIRGQVEESIVEPVNMRAPTRTNLVHYLAHRAVVRVGKSTPIRIVFDAAARSGKFARSLNDLILKGGNWVHEIPEVLLRFRRYGVAVTSDISRAFHQISIAPKDRDVVRFLWLRDLTKPPSRENLVVYRFRRMAFGVVASPFLLTATIRHHMREHPHEFVTQIEDDLYADNLVASLPRTTDAEAFYRTIKASFADMSMNISQWATDCAALRKVFTKDDAITAVWSGVLGLDWHTERAEMRVRSPKLPLAGCAVATKRSVLKEMATVYDPLGWVSPVVLLARKFLRKVWRAKYAWEAPLAEALATEWRELRPRLNEVSEVTIPRPYGFGGLELAESTEMHVFCDASGEAYGVVVYLRVVEQRRVWTGVIAAKTRLVPNTPLSMPRLELLAAVTASKYACYVERALKLDNSITKYLWGDSRCVIAWVSSNKILPAFVERSVRIVRDAAFECFNYVPTAQNPADAASRGATMAELREKRWWLGPEWLARQESWPDQREICNQEANVLFFEAAMEVQAEYECVLLVRATLCLRRFDPADAAGAPFDLHPGDFGATGALFRRTAYCLRAAGRFLRGRGTISAVGALNYEEARRRWLQWDQRRAYEPATSNKSNVSYLNELRVSTDEAGLFRCGTRLTRTPRARDEKEPVLLVKKSALTRLLILSTHTSQMHAGTAHTLAALRRRYWLPQGRREVYQTIKAHCHTCRRHTAQPFKAPEMPPLPPFRVTRTETPFANIGIDTFGPYKVRISAERDAPLKKYWVVVFTCLVVRAVHLEVLVDMTAEEFLNSLRRYVSRRGVPRLIVCDNAPQFEVVDRTFQCMWRRFAEADVAEKYYAQHGIQWRFIPAHSPWMGGAYERLIKEAKGAFRRVYGQLSLTARQFELAIMEVEAVLNSRPITYVDRNEETELITPNDFLCTRYPAMPIDFSKSLAGSTIATAWKASHEYLEQFWRTWSEDYLRSLRERRDRMPSGRADENREPKVGEMVLMIGPASGRSAWRMAVVERLIKGEDGKVRAAQIRTGARTRLIRPIIKLASLKLLMDSPVVDDLTADQRAVVVSSSGGEIQI